MGSIFDSIVTAVMEPAKAVAAEQSGKPAAVPAPAAPPSAPASAGRGAAPAPRPAPAAAVGSAVGAAVARAEAAAAPAQAPTPSTVTSKPKSPAEVEAAIAAIAATRKETYNWKQSIVDLMKLLQLDSSLTARKQLAQELGYEGKLDGSAEMNLWLHKQVMQKLASGEDGTGAAR